MAADCRKVVSELFPEFLSTYRELRKRQIQRSAKNKPVAETYLDAGVLNFKEERQLCKWKCSLRKDSNPEFKSFLYLFALTIGKGNTSLQAQI